MAECTSIYVLQMNESWWVATVIRIAPTMNTTTLACKAHLRPTRSVTMKKGQLPDKGQDRSLTEVAEQGAKECSCLESRGDIAGDAGSCAFGDTKVLLEASTGNRCTNKS